MYARSIKTVRLQLLKKLNRRYFNPILKRSSMKNKIIVDGKKNYTQYPKNIIYKKLNFLETHPPRAVEQTCNINHKT